MSSDLHQRIPTPRPARSRHPDAGTSRWRHLQAAGLALTLAEGGDMEQAMVACEVGLDDGFNPQRAPRPPASAQGDDDTLDDDDDPPTPTPELPQ